MTFDLDYLVDNGRLTGWATDFERGCKMKYWGDDQSFSVLDASGKPLGWDETKEGALMMARGLLTNRRRERDGVIAKRIA